MITGIKESRKLIKHISYKCECKFDARKCNLNQKWNNDNCRYECKNPKEYQCKKGPFWNPATSSCKNGKYARSIGDSLVTCNEIIEETKPFPTKSTSTKTVLTNSTSTNFYILLTFLSITITLLIAISIYLIKDQSKQKKIITISRHQLIKRNWY